MAGSCWILHDPNETDTQSLHEDRTRIECAKNHTFCTSCLIVHMKEAVGHGGDTWPVKCPRFADCKHVMTPSRTFSLLTRTPGFVPTEGDMSSLEKLFNTQVGPRPGANPFVRNCGAPDCKATCPVPIATLLDSTFNRTAAICSACGISWCPCESCYLRLHAGVSCSGAAVAVREWNSFIQIHKEICGDAYKEATEAFERRKKHSLAMKAARLMRKCPHCGKGPIVKIDGCNSMTCGKDASDKGGTERYKDGCGKGFGWNAAPDYEETLIEFQTPPTAPELRIATAGLHHPTLMCTACSGRMVVGTAFQGLHNRNTTYCWTCMRKQLARGHDLTETFCVVQPNTGLPPAHRRS